MSPHTPTIDDTYRRYADLLLRHSRLLAERGDEDAETEAVEEEMTRLWDHLDAVQRRSLSGLGSDLNWARNGCQLTPRSRRSEDVTSQEFQAIGEAKDRGDWHGVLHHLRVCSPRIPPFGLAGQRALAWRAIGFPQLASVFFDLASELEPSNGLIAFSSPSVRPHRSILRRPSIRARTILDDPFRHPTEVVALAIGMLVQAR